MVMTALLQEQLTIVWLMLLFASAGVLHHAGIKVPFFAFFAHDSGIKTQEAPTNMLVAMAIAAFLCIFIGVQPQYLYAMLPWEMDYWPYDVSHVLAQLQLLFFAALAFVWMEIKGYAPPELHSTNIDVEWLYRKLLPATASAIFRSTQALVKGTEDLIHASIKRTGAGMRDTRAGRFHFAASWPTGIMVFWIAVILGTFLVADAFQ